jgi:CBS domain-containing protein
MPKVSDQMAPVVVTVEPSATVVEAAQRMVQNEKGPLPVVESGRVIGMVTDRDILARVVAADREPHSVRVSDIATKDLVTVRPNVDVGEARRLMSEHQLDRIIVAEEDNHLVGIISEADLRRDEGPLG